MIRYPIKFWFDCSGAWLSLYQLFNLSITPQRLVGSCTPTKSHDPIYTNLWWYFVALFRHPTKSSFDCSWAWLSWYKQYILGMISWRLVGSCCPTHPHDPIYTDRQRCTLWMFRHLAKATNDQMRAWMTWYLIYNLSLTRLRWEESPGPGQPHDVICSDLPEYIYWRFRHPTQS